MKLKGVEKINRALLKKPGLRGYNSKEVIGHGQGEKARSKLEGIRRKDADPPVSRLRLKGTWFPDAFAATMGELMRAIQEDDEPAISGRDNLKTLRLALAAVQSSEENRPISLE